MRTQETEDRHQIAKFTRSSRRLRKSPLWQVMDDFLASMKGDEAAQMRGILAKMSQREEREAREQPDPETP